MIGWSTTSHFAVSSFLRFSVYLRIPRIPRSPRYGASFSIGENWPGPIGDAGFGALDALDALALALVVMGKFHGENPWEIPRKKQDSMGGFN